MASRLVNLPTDVAVTIHVAAFMEATMYHGCSKEIKGHCQDNQKHDLCNFEPGRPCPCRGRRIRVGCHMSYTLSGDVTAMAPPFALLGFIRAMQ